MAYSPKILKISQEYNNKFMNYNNLINSIKSTETDHYRTPDAPEDLPYSAAFKIKKGPKVLTSPLLNKSDLVQNITRVVDDVSITESE